MIADPETPTVIRETLAAELQLIREAIEQQSEEAIALLREFGFSRPVQVFA